MTDKGSYRVVVAGWIAGQRVTAGDIVSLTKAEAKYEAVSPVEPAFDPSAQSAPTRKKGRSK